MDWFGHLGDYRISESKVVMFVHGYQADSPDWLAVWRWRMVDAAARYNSRIVLFDVLLGKPVMGFVPA